MIRLAFATLLVAAPPPPAAQETPLDAFKSNIGGIQTRARAPYLPPYLHTPALARAGPDGLRGGYEGFARGGTGPWPAPPVPPPRCGTPLSSCERAGSRASAREPRARCRATWTA